MNLWWVRRDLRLADNPALSAALAEGAGVIPVFILDERLLARQAEARKGFLFAGLRELDADLRRLGSRLVIRRGEPVRELALLVEETGACSVFAEADISPYARSRDREAARQVNLRLIEGSGVHPAGSILKPDGTPYTVFTPFKRAWLAAPLRLGLLTEPAALPPVPELPSEPIPGLPAPGAFAAGEREARRRLAAFLDGPVFQYASGRNRLDLDGTSTLSPYLRFGMLSARQAVSAALRAAESAPDATSRAGCESWLNELVWREFYQSILYHYPGVLKGPFRPDMRRVRWRSAPTELHAWQAGQTGYPVVDAAMRQLAATGWMHNRARMIAASFLVKDLLIDWREGERWFMQMLVDGDPAANNGGWQWVAGTGTDAAPYFRIFNPILQGQKFDPLGDYVRRWVPELAAVPGRYIHAPWEMPLAEQLRLKVLIGKDYPAPVVDHPSARRRALLAYAEAGRRGASNRVVLDE